MTSENKSSVKDQIISEVIEKVSVVLGIPPDHVCLVPPRSIPKTSSGKLQRSAAKKMYMDGKFFRKGLPAWAQIIKLMIIGFGMSLKRYSGKTLRYLYTAYVSFWLILILPLAWLSLLLTPKKIALPFCQFLAKSLLLLMGSPLRVVGKENINPELSYVFVSNHASYVDSLYMFAILPKNVLFVGKRELKNWPFIKTAINKLGYLTVDRVDFSKDISDTDLIKKALQEGHSVFIFPEGTFTYATGLRPFKLGAFKVAVDTQTPICPISLKGTRNIQRGDSLLLSLSIVSIKIGKPILPNDKEWSEVTRLHALVREEIAQNCGGGR